jgi:Zn-dependent peptidase ImmA (M78 family)
MDSKVMLNIDELVKPYVSDGSVDVAKLASDHNILIYRTSDTNVSGKIRYDKAKKTFSIGLKADEPATRQRFSIAHELSHYLLHRPTIIKNGSMGRPTQTSYTPIERQADSMAGEILMPEYLVREFLEEYSLADKLNQPETIMLVADRFNVSPTMAVQRLRELHYNIPYISFA